MTVRRLNPLAALLGLALIAGACGGDDSNDDNGGLLSGGDGDSEVVVGGDLDLPDYFPSDFYIPADVKITSVSNLPESNMMALSASFEGEAEAVRADIRDGLIAAGYELINEDADFTVFIKNGVGRIRIRARDFLGEPTLTVDIDTWTNEQLDELRALSAPEVFGSGRATATVAGEPVEAEGECIIKGPNLSFLASDARITLQIDETQPDGVYADVTTSDGVVYTLDRTTAPQFGGTGESFSANGAMVDFNNQDAGSVDFAIEVTCDS